MKKFIFILFVSICLVANAVSYKDQKGIIRMIYGGDTLIFQFVGDTNQFTGNNKFFDITGAVTFDSIRFKNSVSWYSALITPSNSVDVSSAPDSALFMEMNDTIGWLATVYYSKGKLVIPGIYVNAGSDTNKIINTSGTGKNLIQSANENIFDAVQNSFKINGITKAWHDINGFHAYVSDMDTLILGDDTIIDFTDRINEFVIDSNLVNRQELGDSIDSLETRIGCKLHVNISKDGNITSFNTLVTLTAYVNETGVTYNWDGGAGSNKTLITPTTGNHNVVVSKSGCINDTAEIYIVDQTDFHENYNIELPTPSGNDTVWTNNYHPGVGDTYSNGITESGGTVGLGGSLTGNTSINIDAGYFQFNETANSNFFKIAYGSFSTGYYTTNVGNDISWDYNTFQAYGQDWTNNYYADIKYNITENTNADLYISVTDPSSNETKIDLHTTNGITITGSKLNIFDSALFYLDSVRFWIPFYCDSIYTNLSGSWADEGLSKDYNYGNFWEDLNYALQNGYLITFKDKSDNWPIQRYLKALAITQERTIRQMADELIIRDNEIIRLERKIDKIQLLRNEKLIYALIIILFGLVFILMIKKK